MSTNLEDHFKIFLLFSVYQDDFEMVKDVDVSGDFVAVDETTENVEEKEVKN